jgi:hypothetical protein
MRPWIAALLTSLALALPAGASTIDWEGLVPAWDDTDQSGSQSFLDVDGSGVDITVDYTDNMFDRDSVPNIYGPEAPTAQIMGSLRWTNDRDAPYEPSSITITFSEDVYIDLVTVVSLSTIAGLNENLVVEARDQSGMLVAATGYGTNTPGLVQLDVDGDASYHSLGLGAQEAGLYGDTTYDWTQEAIRSITFSGYVTDPGGTTPVLGWSSQGIGDIDFRVVPEPTSALLLGLGLLGLTASRRRR